MYFFNLYKAIILVKLKTSFLSVQSREHDSKEPIPHTGPSSNYIFFKSHFNAWSYCAAILRTTTDWSVVT